MHRIPTVTNHLTHRSPVSPILTSAPIPPLAAPPVPLTIRILTIFPLTAVHPAPPANQLLITTTPTKVVDWLGRILEIPLIQDRGQDSIQEILGLGLETLPPLLLPRKDPLFLGFVLGQCLQGVVPPIGLRLAVGGLAVVCSIMTSTITTTIMTYRNCSHPKIAYRMPLPSLIPFR